jgi:uncharacterized coiled-coil DUF342 family protein
MVFEQKNQGDIQLLSSELIRRINEDSRRIKTIEQKIEKIESTSSTLEETVLTQMNDVKINLDRISQRIAAVADRLSMIETDMLRMKKEINNTATKAEVKQLETFVDIVNPITAKFVTKDELQRVLAERSFKKV